MDSSNSENPQKQTSLPVSKKLLIIVFVSSLLFVVSLGVVVYVVYQVYKNSVNSNNSSNSTQIELKNASSNDVQELSRVLVYTGAKSDKDTYYSAALDTLFEYSSNYFKLSDSGKELYVKIITAKYDFKTGAVISYDDGKIGKDPVKYYKEYYSYTRDLTVDDSKLGDLKRIDISYLTKIGDSEENVKRVILIRNLKDSGSLVLNLTYSDDSSLDEYLKNCSELLNKARYKPTNIASNIKAELGNQLVTVTFDRKKWNISTQNDNSLSIVYRSDELEDRSPQFKYSAAYINLSTYSQSSSDPAKEFIEKELKNDEEYYKERNLEVIDSINTVNINGLEYYYFKFKYSYLGATSYVQSYTTKVNEKYLLSIRITYTQEKSKGYEDLVNLLQNINVKPGTSLGEFDRVLGDSTAKIDKAAILGKPATVRIYNRACIDVKLKSTPKLLYSGGKSYKVCGAGFGSGFFVNEDGTVATNSHVASPNPIDTVFQAPDIPLNRSFFNDFAADLQSYIKSDSRLNKATLSQDDVIMLFYMYFLELYKQNIITLTPTYENYIAKFESDFQIDHSTLSLINRSSVYSTSIIHSEKIDSFFKANVEKATQNGKGAIAAVPDITVLKISNSSNTKFPALKLADYKTLTPSEDVIVIGYPGVVDNKDFFGGTSSNISTITKGTLSAIRPNSTNKYNLLQIDASVSPGNSGGPILNSKGEVIGITTYSLQNTGSADYNAGVSVEELEKIVKSKKIDNSVGQISELILEGLNDFSAEKYSKAVSKFDKAMALYPPSSEVLKPLINICNQYISQGLDKIDKEENVGKTSGNVLSYLNIDTFSKLNIDNISILVIIVMCLLALLGFIGLLFALVKIFGRKKVVNPQIPQYNLLNNLVNTYGEPRQNYVVSRQNSSNQFPTTQYKNTTNNQAYYVNSGQNYVVSQPNNMLNNVSNSVNLNQSDQKLAPPYPPVNAA